MLVDAVRAESWRLLQNRTAVFWSVVFVPAAAFIVTLGGYVFLQNKISGVTRGLPPALRLDGGALDLGQSLAQAPGGLANPVVLAFLLIGAATVFAGDYRWETWRLISARDSRSNLIMGKVGAVKLMVLGAMALALLATVGADVAKAVIFDRAVTFRFGGEAARDFGLLFVLAYVRIVQFLLISLLAATMTRSLLAALFVPLVIGVGQVFLARAGAPMFGWQASDWAVMLISPGDAYEVLKAAVQGGMGAAALRAGVGLAAWCLIPFGTALWWFQRQDLSKE